MTRYHETKELKKLRKLGHFTPFLAGLAIGVTASLLLAPEASGNTRGSPASFRLGVPCLSPREP
jgi:hypothetical protein